MHSFCSPTFPANYFNRDCKELFSPQSNRGSEHTALEVRADMFNVFNHTEFKNPDSNINSGTFGQVIDTYNPRLIQFAARFMF